MNALALAQLVAATATFILAASLAKAWALAPTFTKAILTLALYTTGNVLMLQLIRFVGMATAFSVSAVLQLVAVNVVAIVFFGERVNAPQGIGIVMAIIAVTLITIGPRWHP